MAKANELSETERALGDLRVLDLADPKGIYCTKLLADLGADVIKVEPPGGDRARNMGPFFRDDPHPERSLYWFHFNTNKRSITLNLETRDGREILKKLTQLVDIMVETFPPGHLEQMGLGYPVLREINPGLILVSITAFGQAGPWKAYKATDIVGQAVGGLLYLCGWPDLPPVSPAGSPAYLQVSLQAAVGTLIALFDRAMTGQGQQVEVSMHESIPVCLNVSVPRYVEGGEIRKRAGDEHSMPAHGIFACKDGYVDLRCFAQHWERLVQWLDSEDMAADLKDKKWADPSYRAQPSATRHIDEVVRAFFAKHTRSEIYEGAQGWGISVGSVNKVEEVAQSAHLKARDFFATVDHPELGTALQYLGAPFRLSETPWRVRRRAPLIGEHNSEVYEAELGFPRQELLTLKQSGVI